MCAKSATESTPNLFGQSAQLAKNLGYVGRNKVLSGRPQFVTLATTFVVKDPPMKLICITLRTTQYNVVLYYIFIVLIGFNEDFLGFLEFQTDPQPAQIAHYFWLKNSIHLLLARRVKINGTHLGLSLHILELH